MKITYFEDTDTALLEFGAGHPQETRGGYFFDSMFAEIDSLVLYARSRPKNPSYAG